MARVFLLHPFGTIHPRGSGLIVARSAIIAPPPDAVTWSPSTSDGDYQFSYDRLNAKTAGKATSGPNALLRCTTSASTGYFEVLIGTVAPGLVIGLTSSSQATNDYPGDSNGLSYYFAGNIFRLAGTLATYSAYTTGDIIGVCRKGNFAYFSKNGVWQNSADPSAGTGGIDVSAYASDVFIPAANTSNNALDITARFTAASMSYPIPSGVTAWDGTTTTVTHATSGILTGPGSTIAGTAVYNAVHPTSGVLTGPDSTVVGSAARTREHATTGILTGPGSVIVGVAVYNAKHTTSGALVGPGSVVVGSAARTRAHVTTGVLTGPGSTIAGTAVYNAKHTTSGTLTGPGSTVVGSAARFRAFATSGVLVGSGSTIAGAAARSGIVVTVHATSGVLIGQPSIIDGTAARTRQHATSGILTGPPALVVGVNTRWRDHDSSGVLLGVTGVVFGRSFNGTPQLHDIPVDSDNLTDEPASPAANFGSITEPSGQIINHPPYPPA